MQQMLQSSSNRSDSQPAQHSGDQGAPLEGSAVHDSSTGLQNQVPSTGAGSSGQGDWHTLHFVHVHVQQLCIVMLVSLLSAMLSKVHDQARSNHKKKVLAHAPCMHMLLICDRLWEKGALHEK